MASVQVKICGLTRPDQAAEIAQLGVDAIGVVLARSSRQVSPEQAREISQSVPKGIEVVGVFVDSDAGTINRISQQVGLSMVQLHGNEPAEIVGMIDLPCIKAFRIRDENWFEQVRRWLSSVRQADKVKAILLDTYKPGIAGGTGEQFNWQWVVQARQGGFLKESPPIILSGGLNPDNVAQAIRIVKPYAVDASSGVEDTPGIKNIEKVKSFINAVRRIEACLSE